MKTVTKTIFKTSINAPREKVWETLWNDETYTKWTKAFSEGVSEGSYAITDWKKGSKVLFTDGKGNGMVSRVTENIPNEFMGIEHLGEVKDGVEDTTSEKVQQWAGAHEDYTLKTVNGITELTVEMDFSEEFAEMFKDIWPKALADLKALAEAN